MLQQRRTHLTELLGVLESTAHLKAHLDQNQALHPGPWLEPLFQERISQEKMGQKWRKEEEEKKERKEEGMGRRREATNATVLKYSPPTYHLHLHLHHDHLQHHLSQF